MKKRAFLGLLAAGAATTVAELAEAAGSSSPPPGVSFLVRFADRRGSVLVWRTEGAWTSSSARAVEIGRAAVTSGDADEWEYYGYENGKWVKKGGGEAVTSDWHTFRLKEAKSPDGPAWTGQVSWRVRHGVSGVRKA